jgi:uncharacterized protein
MTDSAALPSMDNPEFDQLDAILDDMRQRDEEIPQWEFLEGAMSALACSRRAIAPDEYFPVLLGDGGENAIAFADDDQKQQFDALWQRRWLEVTEALATNVDRLDEDAAYHPEVMDVRGAVACLPEADQAAMRGQEMPSFGQVWALGFMFVVENWPEEWAAPRDKEAADWLDTALERIVALTEDDKAAPTVSMFSEDGPPSVSQARVDAFGEAIWSVYELRQLWHTLGPRSAPVSKGSTQGRNDVCACGSGKKFKKCCGA